MWSLYCVVFDILFILLNKAFDYLCNNDFTTYCIYNTLKFYIKHSLNIRFTRWSCDKLVLHKRATNVINIKQKRLNSQQFRSSSPSLQSIYPSHHLCHMRHWPLLHWNHPLGQVFDAERYNIMKNQWICVYLLFLT